MQSPSVRPEVTMHFSIFVPETHVYIQCCYDSTCAMALCLGHARGVLWTF